MVKTKDMTCISSAVRRVRAEGDLAARINLNFDRLERSDYLPRDEYISTEWPGDFVGRIIQALSYLGEVTERKAIHLDEIIRRLPVQYNSRGYLGPDEGVFDEQQMSGHGWLIAGLVKHAHVFGHEQSLKDAIRMTEGLFLPLRGKMSTYPRRIDERVIGGGQGGNISNALNGWRLSTDIGCAFIGLQGIVPVAIKTRRDDIAALVREMFDVYAETDLVGISAQLHASLAAAGMFVKFHRAFGAPEMLGVGRRTYQLFRTSAVTENYANYNWFRRPLWTEPCAIVDALLLAIDLWKCTGEAQYLDDAHHIYFNALGYAQKPHGGFGCDNCVGAQATYIEPRIYDPIACCNMRGAVGLSELVTNIYTVSDAAVNVNFFFDSEAEIVLPGGMMKLRQTTSYPLSGQIVLKVAQSTVDQEWALRFFVPAWVEWSQIEVTRNGKSVAPRIHAGFVEIKGPWSAGDEVRLAFPLILRTERILNSNMFMDVETYRHGPLILGVHDHQSLGTRTGFQEVKPGHYKAEAPCGIELTPITDVFKMSDAAALKDRRKILFERR